MKKVLCILVLLHAGIVLAQAQGTGDNRPLGDIAREAREQRRLRAANPTAHSAKVMELIADISVSDPDDYESQITDMLERQTSLVSIRPLQARDPARVVSREAFGSSTVSIRP